MDILTTKKRGTRTSVKGIREIRIAVIFAAIGILGFWQSGHSQTSRPLLDSIGGKFTAESGQLTFDSASGLSGYLAYAAVNSPSVRAAFYNWKAASDKTGYVGALPDPVFSFGYFIENVETRVGPQNQKISIKQAFPWFGTLGSRRDMAAHVADAEYQKFIARTLRTNYIVKKAFYEYYFLGRDIELTR